MTHTYSIRAARRGALFAGLFLFALLVLIFAVPARAEAPLLDSQRDYFGDRSYRYGPDAYCTGTSGTVSTGTVDTTVTSIVYLWHPATSTKTIRIHHVDVNGSAGNAGKYLLRFARITAQNAAPGGTALTPAKNDGAAAAATGVVVVGATGAPTRDAVDYFTDSTSGGVEIDTHFESSHEGAKPITLRAGVAEGFEIRTQVTATISTAAAVAATICWTEE